MIQEIKEPIKKSALLVMVVTNKEELVVKLKAHGRREIREFKVLKEVTSRIKTLHLTRSNFSLFRELLCRIPWEMRHKTIDRVSRYPHSHTRDSWV